MPFLQLLLLQRCNSKFLETMMEVAHVCLVLLVLPRGAAEFVCDLWRYVPVELRQQHIERQKGIKDKDKNEIKIIPRSTRAGHNSYGQAKGEIKLKFQDNLVFSMASSVGVVFYWIRYGNHPEVAKGTRGKLPILDDGISVGSAIDQIASNPEHIISQNRYQISAYDESTQRHLSNPSELLTNYSRIYLRVELKTLDASGERSEIGGDEEADVDGVTDVAWSNRHSVGFDWHPIAGSAPSLPAPSPEKVLAISSHTEFPLFLPRLTATLGLKSCPLCRALPVVSPVLFDCCGYECCSECLCYLRTSHLFSAIDVCVVCGFSSAAMSDDVVKSERGATTIENVRGVDSYDIVKSRSCASLDLDDSFGCDGALLL